MPFYEDHREKYDGRSNFSPQTVELYGNCLSIAPTFSCSYEFFKKLDE